MKKVGIVTINDNDNYGNRLQNFATQEVLKKLKFDAITLKNRSIINTKNKFFLRYAKYCFKKIKFINNKKNNDFNFAREDNFNKFNKNINFTKKVINPFSNINSKFDYFIVGSDQVWNPSFARLRDVDFLTFASNDKKISFSASFGVSKIPNNLKKYAKENLLMFNKISVREEAGKKIIEELTGRKDVEILVDPTMLLATEEWDNVCKRPMMLKSDKYILNYYLGNLSIERKKSIDKIAKENGCEIINILDKNSPFYECGPSEFLYLEKNAFLICTDSFHSCVFAILYNRPFIIFDREQENVNNMNSRIETLLSKFQLENRKYNGNEIIKENLECDYRNAYKILEVERRKSMEFLKKALNVKE